MVGTDHSVWLWLGGREDDAVMQWLGEHQGLLWMAGGSVFLGLIGIALAMAFVVRMPADFLQREPSNAGTGLKIGRNILAWLLIAAGAAMLILPGPGLVVLILGVAMADFPGKSRFRAWLLGRGKVVSTINRLRARFSRPPLQTGGASHRS